MSGFSLKFLQEINRIVNEKWDMGDDSVVKPQGKIPTSNIEARYRKEGADMGWKNKGRPIRNKKDFVEVAANHYEQEYAYVWNLINKLGEPVNFDVLFDHLQKAREEN